MKKIRIMLLSVCALELTSSAFGMETYSSKNIEQKLEEKIKDQQPQDLAELLKRNNELLRVSIKQNHLISQYNKYLMEYNSNNFYKSSANKAHTIEEKLNELYEKHNVNVESNSSSED